MTPITVPKGLALTGLLSLVLAVAGCSRDALPTGASGPAPSELVAAPVSLRFISLGGAAAKSRGVDHDDREAESQPLTDDEEIGPEGGKLEVEDDGPERHADGSRAHARLEVDFRVPRGALAAKTEITMAVTGYLLSQLEIRFTPSGLEFVPEARLDLHLQRDRVDLDLSTLYGVHTAAGRTQRIAITAIEAEKNGDVVVHLPIPGFSRYSLGE